MDGSAGRRIRLGPREVALGSADLQRLQPANHLLGDPAALRREMADNGYLFIRGLHDRQEVLDARLEVIKYVKVSLNQEKGNWIPRFHGNKEFWIQDAAGDVFHLWRSVPSYNGIQQVLNALLIVRPQGKNSITHSGAVLKVIEGPRQTLQTLIHDVRFTARAFFHSLLGAEPQTFDFKWLRAMYNEGFTGAHVDWVYMSRGTDQVYTMWTPLGDVTMEMGTLAVCEGSHKLRSFQHFQDTYGSLDIEEAKLKGTGWFTEDPLEITRRFGGQWKSADFRAGDALIFTMRTVHMSTVNCTQFARVSCDTRWQPAGLPSDPRFSGDLRPGGPRFGVFGKDADVKNVEVTMEELKEKWGFGQLSD
ncbi:Hypp1 [Branchiostoma lanceolatum]|uniref:Hypp1 protein n=1 Tax=Branchiostoma lanceolatum TaxID=7740 RepID=A0A8J9YLL3_BRALA|nr:Hypp1 [Branchiostoma lanceolatum]